MSKVRRDRDCISFLGIYRQRRTLQILQILSIKNLVGWASCPPQTSNSKATTAYLSLWGKT